MNMSGWMIGTAAATWGIVMAVAPALQIVRMFRRNSSDDVSVGYFTLLVPGFLLWVAHGITIGDVFLTVPNALAAMTAIAVIAITIRMRRVHRAADGEITDPGDDGRAGADR